MSDMTNDATFTPAGSGPHHLMLGSVTVSRLLGGAETADALSLVELSGLPSSGPGAHVDPWRETFYVLGGELTFQVEQDGVVRERVARHGDTVSIPAGVGHAFRVTSPDAARYLIISTAAGIDSFFADAGEPLQEAALPTEQLSFDRERLRAAFTKYGHPPYSFPTKETALQQRLTKTI